MPRNFGRAVHQDKRPAEVPIATSAEAVVSSNTALPCLALLSAQNGIYADVRTIRSCNDLDGDSLPLSQLIELAGEFGFRAQYVYRDWQWLKLEAASHPVLLLLRNTNVVVALGNRRSGVEEIIISDPLYRDGETIILPREDLEHAWDGDALTIVPQPREAEEPAAKRSREVTEQPRQHRNTPPPFAGQPAKPARHQLRSLGLSRLVSILLGLVLVALISLVLIMVATKKHLTASGSSALISRYASPTETATARLPGNPNGFAPAAVTARPTVAFAAGVQSAASRLVVVALPPEVPPASSLTITPPAVPAPTIRPPPEARGSMQADLVARLAEPPAGLPPADISALLMRGDDYLRTADIVSARLFYQRAAGAGAAEAALRLGETFDPVFLDRAHLHGVAGDIEKAVSWYRRARDLGSTDAKILLKQLDTE